MEVTTVRPVGTVGAWASTVTVAVAVLVPFPFEAVRVYVVDVVGFTLVDPIRVDVEKEPGVIVTELAFVTFQERVDVPAEATTKGDAEKELIVSGFCTFTVVDALTVLLEVSVESAQRVVEPFASDVVFQETEYDVPLAVVSVPIRVLEASVAP